MKIELLTEAPDLSIPQRVPLLACPRAAQSLSVKSSSSGPGPVDCPGTQAIPPPRPQENGVVPIGGSPPSQSRAGTPFEFARRLGIGRASVRRILAAD